MIDDCVRENSYLDSDSEEVEEIMSLPTTSSINTIAFVEDNKDECRLCVVTCVEDDDGIERVYSRIDFNSPQEVLNFAKSLIQASKQTFHEFIPKDRILN